MNFKLDIESPLASEVDGVFKPGGALNATAQSRAPPSQGTSGGGFVGNCKLAVISESDLDGLYCCGKIGTGGVKMCIKEQAKCSIQGHATKALFAPTVPSPSGTYVVIGVAGKAEQVYLSNIVPKEAFKGNLDLYLFDSRSVDEWDELFSTIRAGTLNSEEIGRVAEEAESVALARALTGGSVSPRKRNAGEMQVERLEAEYDTLGKFVVTRSEGDGAEAAFNSINDLQSQMEFLVKRVKRTEVEQLSYPPDEANRSIVALRNLIGPRPEGMAPMPVMETLARLTDLIGPRPEDSTKSVMELISEGAGQLSSVEVTQVQGILQSHGPTLSILVDQLLAAISLQIKGRFEGIDKFLIGWSSFNGGSAALGDKLRTKLDTLEAKLNSITSLTPPRQEPPRPRFDMGLGSAAPGAAHTNFGMHGLSLAPVQPQSEQGSQEAMEKLMADIKLMKEDIAVMKDQLDDTVIDVAGKRFNTRKEFQAWLLTHATLPEGELVKGKTDVHLYFTDALGMLGLVWQDFGGGRDMTFKVQSKKAGYASTDEALFMSSFEGSLPKVFGKNRSDMRTLPDAKSYEVFDSGNPNTSFKTKLEKAVRKQAKLLTNQAGYYLDSEAAPVAKACIASAEHFINNLLNWMASTHISMLQEHGASTAKDNWLFISHSVNAIIESLAEQRAEGYGAKHPHEIIWACLKARNEQNAIVSKNYGEHEVVINVLNQHLQASAVMKSEFDKHVSAMTTKMDAMKREMEAATKKANQALTAAQTRK